MSSTVTVPCVCAGANPGCVNCYGTGTVDKRACQRCHGKGTEGTAPCLDCRGHGWRDLDQRP